MTEHNGLPVKGYQPQSDEKVALVNRFKEMEERLLRELDSLGNPKTTSVMAPTKDGDVVTWRPVGDVDQRWLAIARTHFQEGFMALNRSVFQPGRVKLPEDEPHLAEEVRAALNDIAS